MSLCKVFLLLLPPLWKSLDKLSYSAWIFNSQLKKVGRVGRAYLWQPLDSPSREYKSKKRPSQLIRPNPGRN
jgi:hypothetical protein